MRLMLVEDDLHKLEDVKAHLSSEYPEMVIDLARSVSSALKGIEVRAPDLLLLDMSLPVFDYSSDEDGFRHVSYGGKDVLEHLDRIGAVTRVVVLTAFERFGDGDNALSLTELVREMDCEFPEIVLGVVWYSAHVDSWKDQLVGHIESFRTLREGQQ